MTGTVEVHEPGSYRFSGWYAQTPRTWGTVEEQIAEATQSLLEQHSGIEHEPGDLYMMADDCPHTDPEEDPKYDGIDDLVDAKMAEMYPGLKQSEFKAWWARRRYVRTLIPLVVEADKASDEYHANHNRVCLLEPMGTYCKSEQCYEGDEDYGIEAGSCRRQEQAKDDQDEFWYTYGGMEKTECANNNVRF